MKLGIAFLAQISRSRFKKSKISQSRIELFCKFFGNSWVYSGINSSSQTIRKIDGDRKFGRFEVVLKLEFKAVKIGRYTRTKQLSATSLGCPVGSNQLSGGVPKLFLFLYF